MEELRLGHVISPYLPATQSRSDSVNLKSSMVLCDPSQGPVCSEKVDVEMYSSRDAE